MRFFRDSYQNYTKKVTDSDGELRRFAWKANGYWVFTHSLGQLVSFLVFITVLRSSYPASNKKSEAIWLRFFVGAVSWIN